MNAFDTRIIELVRADQLTYTRYADDLTFSAKRTGFLTGVEKALRLTIHEIRSPSLTINEGKTVLATTKYKRTVTGLKHRVFSTRRPAYIKIKSAGTNLYFTGFDR